MPLLQVVGRGMLVPLVAVQSASLAAGLVNCFNFPNLGCPLGLQVNLKLFAPEPNRRRTVLLFVIRDKSKTPLSKLVEVLSEDVHKMWDTISKPPQYADSKIDDFFEVRMVAPTAWTGSSSRTWYTGVAAAELAG